MCQLIGISRASYYKWVKRFQEPDPDQERMALVEVEAAWKKPRKIYGYRRVTLALQEQGYEIMFCG